MLYSTCIDVNAYAIVLDFQGILRTSETIQKLQQFIPKSTTALAFYFNTLLSQGRLNCYESLALSKRLIQTGKTKVLEDWLKQDKVRQMFDRIYCIAY